MSTSTLPIAAPHDAVPLNEEPDRPQMPGARIAHVTRARRTTGVFLLLAVVGFGVVVSLAVGSKPIPLGTVIRAFTDYDGSDDHLIVRELRLPRTIVGVLVGRGARRPGALMQAITRNPLADPGLLGVSAGASLAVVTGIFLFSVTSLSGYVWFAFIGAGLASIVVYALGSMGRGGATPVRLALAGAALSALLDGFTSAIVLLDRNSLELYRFWAVGSLAGRDTDVLVQVAPFLIIGLLMSIVLSRPLNAIALGEDAARALGTNIAWTRFATAIAVTLLAGAATAACGPIGFIGLDGAARRSRDLRTRPTLDGPVLGDRSGRRCCSAATSSAASSTDRPRSRSGS